MNDQTDRHNFIYSIYCRVVDVEMWADSVSTDFRLELKEPSAREVFIFFYSGRERRTAKKSVYPQHLWQTAL